MNGIKTKDEWNQDEEGFDEEFGSGGICDQISNAIIDIVNSNIPNVNFIDGGQDGDDHAYPVIYDDTKAYIIDIPPYIYEIGGGYVWRKIPNVILTVNNIMIEEIDRDLVINKNEI